MKTTISRIDNRFGASHAIVSGSLRAACILGFLALVANSCSTATSPSTSPSQPVLVPGTWAQTNGPVGVVRTLAVRGTNLFAGTYEGEVFRSMDNGTSWTQASDSLTSRYVYALAASGTNASLGTSGPPMLFAGAGNGNGTGGFFD